MIVTKHPQAYYIIYTNTEPGEQCIDVVALWDYDVSKTLLASRDSFSMDEYDKAVDYAYQLSEIHEVRYDPPHIPWSKQERYLLD